MAAWALYCNDKRIGEVYRHEDAVQWLAKMEAADTEQEFTWSFTRIEHADQKP